MQPNDLAAERDGFGEERSVGRQGQSQAWADEVRGEACSESGVGHNGGDVGQHILGTDLLGVDVCKEG